MSPSTRRLVPGLVAAVVLVVVLGILAVAVRGGDTDPVGAGPTGASGSSGSSGSDDRAGQGGMAPPSGGEPGGDPASGTGSDAGSGAGSDPGSGADDPMTRFTAVSAGADGRSVEVRFYGGVDTCYSYAVRADETGQQVALSLSEQRRGDGPCIDLAQEYERSVPLDGPLGDRRVVDAATGDVLLEPGAG